MRVMNINIEIPEETIKQAVLELIAEDVTRQLDSKHGSSALYVTNREVKEVIRELFKERMDVFAEKAIKAAAKSIENKAMKKLPANAKWITEDDSPKCSNCGYIPAYDIALDNFFYSEFCPSCGSRMDGEQDDGKGND